MDHSGISSAEPHQLLVGSALCNFSGVQQENQITLPHGRQPVGNEHAGTAVGNTADRFLKFLLRQGIDVGGGFIKNQNTGTPDRRARKREHLPLPC